LDFLYSGNSALGPLFALCAIVGGALFVIRLLLQFLGLAGDVNVPDASDVLNGDVHSAEVDAGFKWLSLQGLTAFFTLFGLVGLAMDAGDMNEFSSLIAALVAGCLAVWSIEKLFKMMAGLQSSGNVNIHNAVGKEGTVYLSISPSERGKVEINIQNRLRVLDAMTENGSAIATGETVRVLKVFDSSVLVVERVTPKTADTML